ncbi:MAG: H-type lectin domain-containing protein [Alicyclobacillus macrosporangiidus]|uniref:H-type lectin domain-containing protein n=1 Tax=Alicyclobacillus macrosporangiidus TaxID=392015 RepID=UPI0026F150A5|nr:H-type lectin domain-containing protein [Alicyclobacillus macrosporangiidus]MCL6597929.1 H-type lectin domain-containing protein [Alicyclobacillus macrosporangiidus]
MSSQTQKLGLTLWDGNDSVNRQAFNDNWTKIDEAAQKNITQSSTPPSNPADQDLWIDTSTTPNRLKRYVAASSSWQVIGVVTASDVGAVPASEVGQPGGVASLDSTGKVPSSQLPPMNYIPTSAAGAPNGVATLDGTGKVPVSQMPTVAARTDQANTFTAKQTFSGGFDLPSGQSGTVEGTLQAGTGGTIHATNSDNLGGNPPSYYLAATAQAADSAKLGGQPPSYYLPATAQAADSAKLGGQPPSYYAPISSPNFSGTPQVSGKNILQALSGGYKVQSGSFNVGASTSGTITFPAAFSSVPIVVTSGSYGNNGNVGVASVTSVSTGSFSWYTSSSFSNQTVYWIAIGT